MLHWQRRKAEFRYPIGRAPRTAVLVRWFRESGGVRVFRGGWCEEAARFQPQAIAATWPQLETLMGLAVPDRAIIVLARPGQALLTTGQRERLWRAFHVPVFEQIIGDRGEVLAAECEAHDGLHLESSSFQLPPSVTDPGPCACGRKSPRMLPDEPAERARAAAAYAR